MVSRRSNRQHDYRYTEYNNNLYSDIHGSGLSSCYRNGYGDRKPSSADYGDLDGMFRFNIPVSKRRYPGHMVKFQYCYSYD